MRSILMMNLILLFSGGFIFAQEPKTNPAQMQDSQKQMEKIHQDMEKRQQQELERLKETDPQAYQERRASLDRQAQIQALIASFQAGKISLSQAESQLYPLVEEDMQVYINNLGVMIQRQEKQLEFLKEVRSDPQQLIKKRIDELLGKSRPNPEDLLIY